MKNKGQKEKHRLPLIFLSQRISVQVDIGVLSQIMTTVAIDQCAYVRVCVCVYLCICTCTCKLKVHIGSVIYTFAVNFYPTHGVRTTFFSSYGYGVVIMLGQYYHENTGTTLSIKK